MSERKPYTNPDTLQRLYHDEDMSQREIAAELDCSQAVVSKYMKKHDIDRPKSRNDPTRAPTHKFDKMGEPVGTEYETICVTVDYKPIKFYIHRLLAVATGDLDPSDFGDSNTVVHHKTDHGLDNRPENIAVMDRGDHQTMHNEERYG